MTITEGQVYSEEIRTDGAVAYIIRVTRTAQTWLVTVEHGATGAQLDAMRWPAATKADAWAAVQNRRAALTLALA